MRSCSPISAGRGWLNSTRNNRIALVGGDAGAQEDRRQRVLRIRPRDRRGTRRRFDGVGDVVVADCVGQADDRVDEREIVRNLGERRADGRRTRRQEINDAIGAERQHLDRVKSEVGIVRQLIGLLPEGIDLLDGNPGVGILEGNEIELRGGQDLTRVEAKPRARIEQGPARHAENCAAHRANVSGLLFAGPFLRARSVTAGLAGSDRPATLRSVLIGLTTSGSADVLFLLVFAARRLFGLWAHIRPTISAVTRPLRRRHTKPGDSTG